MTNHQHPYTRLDTMLVGCTTTLPANASILIAGQPTSQPAIVTKLQSFAAKVKDAADKKLAYDQALKDRDAIDPQMNEYLNDLAVGLKANYGESNPVLSKYGVPVKKARAKLTGKAIVQKSDKAQATRAARGTKGKKQKKDIHGVVPAPAPANGAGNGAPATPNKP
jgi:hypothetical protein